MNSFSYFCLIIINFFASVSVQKFADLLSKEGGPESEVTEAVCSPVIGKNLQKLKAKTVEKFARAVGEDLFSEEEFMRHMLFPDPKSSTARPDFSPVRKAIMTGYFCEASVYQVSKIVSFGGFWILIAIMCKIFRIVVQER